jgi:hypothetical protein
VTTGTKTHKKQISSGTNITGRAKNHQTSPKHPTTGSKELPPAVLWFNF